MMLFGIMRRLWTTAFRDRSSSGDETSAAESWDKWMRSGDAALAEGRLDDALESYARALSEAKKFNSRDDRFKITLTTLATAYSRNGDTVQAEHLFKWALALAEKDSGSDDVAVAGCWNNLAILRQEQGRYAEAEELFRRAITVTESALGTNHPDVAACLRNLAVLFIIQDKYAEAEQLNKRGLDIWENSVGADHGLMNFCVNLALVYGKHGKDAEAEAWYEKALLISELRAGPVDCDIATIFESYILLLQSAGREGEARHVEDRVKAIRERLR